MNVYKVNVTNFEGHNFYHYLLAKDAKNVIDIVLSFDGDKKIESVWSIELICRLTVSI